MFLREDMQIVPGIPAEGRIGRRGNEQYALYLDRTSFRLLLNEQIGPLAKNTHVKAEIKVITDKYPSGLRLRVRLTINKSYKPPRVTVWLPRSLNSTWESLYDKEVEVVIEALLIKGN